MRHVTKWAAGLCVLALFGAALRADDKAEATAVLDKAIEALGGREKLARFQSVTWKGKATIQAGGQDIALVHEGAAQSGDRYRVEMEIQANGMTNKVLFVINGEKAWARANNQTTDLPKEVAAFARDGLYVMRLVQLLPNLREKEYELSHLGEVKVGDSPAVGIQVARKGFRDVSLFFAKDTGLPVRSETRLTAPDNQEYTVAYLFADYKEFGGIRHFTRVTFKVNDQDYATELTEVQAPDTLEDGTFEKPG
jgi:hypothetical protein